jgi:hypothetical protein
MSEKYVLGVSLQTPVEAVHQFSCSLLLSHHLRTTHIMSTIPLWQGEVKVKLSLRFTKHNAMKTYCVVEV